jgi:putative transposase
MDMKSSRFTEEQIIGILREQEAGAKTADVCRKPRNQQRNLLQMECQVWRAGSVRCQATEGAWRTRTQSKKLLAAEVLDNAMLKEHQKNGDARRQA